MVTGFCFAAAVDPPPLPVLLLFFVLLHAVSPRLSVATTASSTAPFTRDTGTPNQTSVRHGRTESGLTLARGMAALRSQWRLRNPIVVGARRTATRHSSGRGHS